MDNGTTAFDVLGSTGIAIGSRRAGRPPTCWEQFDAILNVTDTCYPEMLEKCCNGRSQGENHGYYLQLPVQEGKRYRTELEKWMAVGICFCVLHAQAGRRILIHCAQGKDRSVCVALALVVLFCDLHYPLGWKESFAHFDVQDFFCKIVSDEATIDAVSGCDGDCRFHQASGIPTTAIQALLGREGRDKLLQAVREHNDRHEDKGARSADDSQAPLATKETLRIALHLIRQDREQAEPTRSSMQKLNRFFMSGAFEQS